MDLATEIDTQLKAAGIPVVTVRDTDGTLAGLEIEYAPEATDEQRAEGQQIAERVLAGDP
jgi:ABC-type sugar transport system substrate-binding protein